MVFSFSVLSCTADLLIHIGFSYLQPLCDFLSSKGPWFTPVAQMMRTQFVYTVYYKRKTVSQTTNAFSRVVNTVVNVVQGLTFRHRSFTFKF
jgi:hypothetical protein